MSLIKRMRPLLGTFVEISVVSDGLTQQCINGAFMAAFARIEAIQQGLSFHQPDSLLSQLNLHPGRWQSMPPDCLRALKLAQSLTRLSGGLFNFSLGKTLVDKGILPDHGFGLRQPFGDANGLVLRASQVKLNQAVLVCLDGLAKGFAVDCGVAALRRAGVKSGAINAGGDMRAFGDYQLPIILSGQQQPVGLLHQAAIATSSAQSCEAFPGCLLTAQGAELANGQWTVMATMAWRADALTKVASAKVSESQLAALGGRLIEAHLHSVE